MQVASAKKNWFCNSCDVIISEIITKSNKPEATSTVLTDSFDTAIHKSLDKATVQIVKVLSEKTSKLHESIKQVLTLTEDECIDTSNIVFHSNRCCEILYIFI